MRSQKCSRDVHSASLGSELVVCISLYYFQIVCAIDLAKKPQIILRTSQDVVEADFAIAKVSHDTYINFETLERCFFNLLHLVHIDLILLADLVFLLCRSNIGLSSFCTIYFLRYIFPSNLWLNTQTFIGRLNIVFARTSFASFLQNFLDVDLVVWPFY